MSSAPRSASTPVPTPPATPHFDRLLEAARRQPPVPTAVVAPEERSALEGALLAAREGIIAPVLVGDRALIAQLAEEIDADLGEHEIIDVPGHEAAAARGVALVHEGRASAVMKGYLHTDELLRAVVRRDAGLRIGRRLSHVFVFDVPHRDQLLLVTDAAINIAPDLATKADITRNAIDLARALGIELPRVAVLSAVESVNPDMPSTLDAAALSKMADRGQITGGLVDGPFGMDNAVSVAAASTKGIESEVAGRAEILVVPTIEAGNVLSKGLTYLANAATAGIVLGARVPVILTSRADSEASRLASACVAALSAAGSGRQA